MDALLAAAEDHELDGGMKGPPNVEAANAAFVASGKLDVVILGVRHRQLLELMD
jgi:hypothetical protein